MAKALKFSKRSKDAMPIEESEHSASVPKTSSKISVLLRLWCCSRSVIAWTRFILQTLSLMLWLARTKSGISGYNRRVQQWAVAPFNAMPRQLLSGVKLTPENQRNLTLRTNKTIVWAALAQLRLLPLGRPCASFLANRLQF